MTYNRFILDYVFWADQDAEPGMSYDEKRGLLNHISLQGLSLCIYLAEKRLDKEADVTLDKIKESLLKQHVVPEEEPETESETESEVRIAGYDPEGESVSSFYMRFFYAYEKDLEGFNESEKAEFFCMSMVIPFFYYHYYDGWEIGEEWNKFFRSYLDRLGVCSNMGKNEFSVIQENTEKILRKWERYIRRSGLNFSETQDISSEITAGYGLLPEGGSTDDR